MRWKLSLTAVCGLLAALATDVAAQPQQTYTRADSLRGAFDSPGRAWWDVTFYDLHVRVQPADSSIRGHNAITYRVLQPATELQIDLMTPLEVDSIVQDGRRVPFRRDGNAFFATLSAPQPRGASRTITVYYGGKPRVARRPPWEGGFTWATDSLGRPWIVTTDQGVGASIWWPNKDTQADEPDSMRAAITVPQPLVHVGNGRLRERRDNADGTTTFEWFAASPINNYAINVNAGHYTHYSEVYQGEKGKLTLDFWPLTYHLDAARRQWSQTRPMLQCFEHWFGPYPWYEDGFKLIDVPYNGMEHQSAVTYGNGFANGYRGRDASGTGLGMRWDFIIVHEAAHEWFANNITAKDQADMWVHESFANYAEGIYTECQFGKEAGAQYIVGTRRGIRNDRPIIPAYGVNAQGSGDMYPKGGNILHTIRQIIDSDEKWRGVLRGLNETFGRQTVMGSQIERYISERAGIDLGKVFGQYLRTTQIPELEYRIEGNTLHYRWTNVVAGFDMPLRITLGRAGARVIRPTESWQSLTLDAAALAEFQVDVNYYVTAKNSGSDGGAARDAARAGPIFINGLAQVVPAFADSAQWIRHELWVETEFDSDGDGRRDRVHVDVTRPRQTATGGLKVPVIYESSPYYAGTSGPRQFLWDVKQELGEQPPKRTSQPPVPFQRRPTSPRISSSHVDTWVPRGFAVVHSESPGTGLSQGCPTVGGANESLAPKAVIDWLNGRARGFTSAAGDEQVLATWSTGRVGMTGTSYNGTLPLAAATTGVEGLAAIIPIAPNTSYYHYYRSNGLIRHPGGWLGEDIDFLYDYINSGRPERREYCNTTIRDREMLTNHDRVSGDYNDFWAGRDYLSVVDRVRAATLMAHAFNDWNVVPEHSVRIYEALKKRGVPVQAYYHQGGHGGAPPPDMMNRWFTRYLYGIENGVENEPRAWIVRERAPRLNPTPYADYPNPAASPVTLRPSAGGRAVGGLSAVPRSRQGSERLVDDVSLSGAVHARATQSEHRLLYATPVLREAVHISGTPRITVRLASSKAAANLSVWLVALPWDSAAVSTSVITRGWADPQNHRSLTRGEPLVPGEFYTVTFDLQPDDQLIPAGQRIALMIFSSDPDFTLWPPPGTELTVDLDATTLVLPVVGGAAALERALAAQTER